MAKSGMNHRMMIRVMLCAPITTLCHSQIDHVCDAAKALAEGGLDLRTWLGLLLPHSMTDAWISIEWQDHKGNGLWVRYRVEGDGSVCLDEVIRNGAGEESVPDCFGEGRSIGACAVMEHAEPSYTFGQVLAWACSSPGDVGAILPGLFGAGEGSEGPSPVGWVDLEEIIAATKRRPWSGGN